VSIREGRAANRRQQPRSCLPQTSEEMNADQENPTHDKATANTELTAATDLTATTAASECSTPKSAPGGVNSKGEIVRQTGRAPFA